MELQRIKSLCERRKGGLRGLAIAVGMTEQNLHRCIRENKIQAGDLERIATELDVDIDFFFKEGASAKDAPTLAGVNGNHTAANVSDAVLSERVKLLQQLILEKDERIAELKERIEELKAATNKHYIQQ
ncbi:MAG: hypothetical protein ACI30K_02495 [Muribaculaceae bacterium]